MKTIKNNPYTKQFGLEPSQLISRSQQEQEIIDTFSADYPSQHTYMITGVRGSGKTVFLGEIVDHFQSEKSWICVNLTCSQDMLISLISKLANHISLRDQIRSSGINLSFFGISMNLTGSQPETNSETAVERILENIKKHNQRLLIAIDEITNTDYVREFCSSFQLFIREKYPVFLIMTGLYENITALQNTPNLTFLYRAERIVMNPLSLMTIADNYENVFHTDRDTALKMAAKTKGYSFAFQVLGYYTWMHDGDYQAADQEYYRQLAEYSYIKIWQTLSANDRVVLSAMTEAESDKVLDIRKILGWELNQFSPYRDRLIRKGLITNNAYGHLTFSLPEFDRFIREYNFLLNAE